MVWRPSTIHSKRGDQEEKCDYLKRQNENRHDMTDKQIRKAIVDAWLEDELKLSKITKKMYNIQSKQTYGQVCKLHWQKLTWNNRNR